MGAAPGVAVRVAQRNARALIPAQREGTELIASLKLLPGIAVSTGVTDGATVLIDTRQGFRRLLGLGAHSRDSAPGS
jgi:hypothetical protein